MRTAVLQGEKTVADVIRKLYGPNITATQAGAAEKALLAINPHLAGDISSLPAGTPIVIPVDPSLALTPTGTTDHPHDLLVSMLDGAVAAANQVASSTPTQPHPATLAPPAATASGQAGKDRKRQSKAEKEQQKATADALRTLAEDVSAFKKMHGL
jgi:hypothetical protein